ncbi:unnamed protein product [Lampetra fluviatilis]
MENLSSFIRAIQQYGMRPHDIFEANDLFESGNMTRCRARCLHLLTRLRLRE